MMMYQLLTTVSSNKVTAGEVGCTSGQCQRPSLSQSKCLQGLLPPNLSPPPPKVCPLPEEPVGEPGLAEAGGGA